MYLLLFVTAFGLKVRTLATSHSQASDTVTRVVVTLPLARSLMMNVHTITLIVLGLCTSYYSKQVSSQGTCSPKPISNLTAMINSSYVATGVPFDLTIFLEAGSPVTYSIHICKDCDLVNTTTVERIDSCLTYNETVVQLVLMDRGQYGITVCASNNISCGSVELDVTAQDPIKDFVVYQPPLIHVIKYPIKVTVSYKVYPKSPRPSNLYFSFKTDLNNLEGLLSLETWDTNWPPTGNQTFDLVVPFIDNQLSHGLHFMSFRLFNKVSDFSASTNVLILQDLANVTVTSSNGLGSKPTQDLVEYSLGVSIHFDCVAETGTIEWVTWEISNYVSENTSSCSWDHTFLYPGNYTVSSTISGRYSSATASVRVAIIGSVEHFRRGIFTIITNKYVQVNQSATFRLVTNFAVSTVECIWDFNDGVVTAYSHRDLQSAIVHVFQNAGEYIVTLSCNSSHGIEQDFIKVQVSPHLDVLNCRVTDENGQTNSSFLFGDGSLLFHYDHKIADNVKYIFLRDGNYLNVTQTTSREDDNMEGTLSVSGESFVRPGEKSLTLLAFVYDLGVQCTMSVDLQRPVRNISAFVDSSIVMINMTFDLTVKADAGDPVNLKLTVWREEQKYLEMVIGENLRGWKVLSITTSLEFEVAGLYNIMVNGWNDHSFESLEWNMTVQNPILGLETDTITPIIWEGSPVPVNITLYTHPVHPPPSNIFINIDFGDGRKITEVGRVDQYTGERQIEALFTDHGIYTVNIRLFNDVSEVSSSVDVHILQEITDVQVESYSVRRSLGSHDVPTYPMEYPVYFNCSMTEGTVHWVTWEVNNDTIENTTACRWEYRTFPLAGTFTVRATVSNLLFEDEGFTTVVTIESVTDLRLVNNGPLMLHQNITFVLFVGSVGEESSYLMTFGDGQSVAISNFTKSSDIGGHLKSGLLLPFNPTRQFSAIISHHYDIDGNFLAMAYGWNLVSSLSALSEVTINLKSCEIPHIHINSGGSNFTVAPKFMRTHAILLHADVSVDCQGSDKTTFRWRLYRLDDIFPYPSIANEVHLLGDAKTHLVECYIPKFTLEYGNYVVEITVTALMRKDGSIGMMEFDQSYLKVVPTPLVPRIIGGSLRYISWYSALSLDGSTSYDPDTHRTLGPDPGLTYSWYCRKSNETFPENLDEDECARCGCFGTGFAITSNPSIGVTARSELSIQAQILEGNKTYTFMLQLSNVGRASVTAEQTIRLLPGDVPSVLIRCIHNCDLYLNPSERFVLSGKCEDCTEFSRPRYEWDLILPDGEKEPAEGFDWKRDTTTGKLNAYVVIKAGVFTNLGVERYILRLHTYSWAGTTNFAEFAFLINYPPSGGSCFIAPSEGVVLSTYFYIGCSRFFDVDTPFAYEIRVMPDEMVGGGDLTEDYSVGSLLYFGVDPIFPPTLLPAGSPSRDYVVDIALIVKDAFGASTVSRLNATVREPSPKAAAEMVKSVMTATQGEDSDMQHLLKSGDTQAAIQLITTVSSILNSETHRNDDDSNRDDKQKDKERETRIQVREQLITDLNQVEIRDLESLQLTSAAVAKVTQENMEISIDAQLSASEIYQKMGNYLQAQALEQSLAGGSVGTIEGTARQLVSGIANILGAASSEEEQSSTSEADTISVNTRQVTLSSMETLKKVEGAILHNKVPGEEPTVLKTDQVEVILNRLEKWELDGKSFEVPGRDTFIKLPQDFRSVQDSLSGGDEKTSYDSILDAHMHHFERNPYAWSRDISITSHVTALDIIEGENQTLEVSGLEDGVHLFLENGIDAESVTLQGKHDSRSGGKIYGFNTSDGASAVVIHIRARGRGDSLVEVPSIKVNMFDELNSTEIVVTFKLPQESPLQMEWNETTVMNADPYSIFLDGDTISEGEGVYYMNLEIGDTFNWTMNWDVEVMTYSPKCYYWNARSDSWKTDGCQVGPLTDLRRLHCICHHLSTFAGGLIPLPNAINLREDILLFAELFENPVTACTVLCVWLVFFLCTVWARKKDRQEDSELEVIYLADNDPRAQYQYHITVFTGMRRRAGTSSTVTVTLYGTHGSSDPHVLSAPHRPVLERGSVDSFMISTDQSIGELTSIRIWHDNSGSHPEWYVSRIIIHDLQSNRWWYFLCRSWLGIGLGDHSLDKTFPAAVEEDLTQFHYLVLSKIKRDIKDQHLWVSVIIRPSHSNFTRLQRAACCLAILLTAMLTNIIFYGVPEEYATVENNISFGSLSLSWSSVVIGVESSIITFPINYLIVELFRNSKLHQRPTGGSTASFSSSLSSFSQSTFGSANSRISSLYESCKTFLSNESNSLSGDASVMDASIDAADVPSNSTRTESSMGSFNSQKPLIGNRCSSVTPTCSVFDSSEIGDADARHGTLSAVDSDLWRFIHSANAQTMEKNSKNVVDKISTGEFVLENGKTDGVARGENNGKVRRGVGELVSEETRDEEDCINHNSHLNSQCVHGSSPNLISTRDGLQQFASYHVPENVCKMRGDFAGEEELTDDDRKKHLISTDDAPDGGSFSGSIRKSGEVGEVIVCLQKSNFDINISRKSDSSGYDSVIHVQRGLDSDHDSLTYLMPPKEGQDDSKDQPFYAYHGDYLQSKLNHLKSEVEVLPEMDIRKRSRYGKASKKLDRVLFLHGWSVAEEAVDEMEEEDDDKDGDDRKYQEFRGCLPWWTIYISWVLVVITCLVSSFFIIIYGLRYGKQQSLDWLVAMFISLFQSVAIVQPFKVVILAAVLAILLPSHTHEQVGLGTNRIVNAREVISKGGKLEIPLRLLRNSCLYRPPPTKKVEQARKNSLAHTAMYSLLKAFLGQVAFIFLVLEIAYMQRDPNTFLMHRTLSNIFTEKANGVRTSQNLTEWMKDVFVPNLYGGDDGFIINDLALRLGGARLRQLRIETNKCEADLRMKSFTKFCGEDDRGSKSMWGPSDASPNFELPWVYQPADTLGGSFTIKAAYTQHDRGGYALYLSTSYLSAMDRLEFIQNTTWIDTGTKAVFIEWNLFNPHTNLLCICSMLYEQRSTGEYAMSFDFEVMRPLDMKTVYDKISLSLESVYIIVILVLILIEVRKYRKARSKYWDFWNLLTLFIIFLSLASTAVYILWLKTLWNVLQSYLREPEQFHSFFRAALVNQIFNYLVAAIVFFSTIKCAKVLRYNRTIHLMQMTLVFLTRKFKMALLIIAVVFFGFSNLAYQLFGSSVYFFYNLVSSVESIFLFISGGFDQFMEVSVRYPVLGPTFFALMSFVLIYIFMNLMIMFIIESFMMAQAYCEELDHRDVVGALIDWFLSALGVKGDTDTEEE